RDRQRADNRAGSQALAPTFRLALRGISRNRQCAAKEMRTHGKQQTAVRTPPAHGFESRRCCQCSAALAAPGLRQSEIEYPRTGGGAPLGLVESICTGRQSKLFLGKSPRTLSFLAQFRRKGKIHGFQEFPCAMAAEPENTPT